MNSEIDQVLEQIQKNIDEISNLDWNKINTDAPKFKVGTQVKCFETRFSKIQSIDLRKFLQELQISKLNDISGYFSILHQNLKMIQDYDPENLRDEAGNTLNISSKSYLEVKATELLSPVLFQHNSSTFRNTLDFLEDNFFNPLRIFIIEQNSPEGYKAEINNLEEQRKQYEEKFQNLQARFDVLNSSSKDETAGIASNEMSEVFKQQANEYKKNSEYWLITSGLISAILLVFIVVIICKFSSLSPITDTEALLKLLAPNIILTSSLTFILFQSFKTFNANRHMYATNKHKENSLKVYKALLVSIDNQIIKESMIKEIANHIFDIGETGFITSKQQHSGSIHDVIKIDPKN
jgi:hypothetical protein